MTDRIDLDDLEAGNEGADEPAANPGDWIWRGEGSPEDEPEPERVTGPAVREDSEADTDGGEAEAETGDRTASESTPRPAPRVPSSTAGKPAGIPTEQGGAGAGTSAGSAGSDPSTDPSADPRPAGSAAEGPHGGGVDDMTLAFTYDALRRVAHPAAVFADANRWADWLGIVGDVGTHRITKFQRTHGVDADFFTGSGTSPAERLREIDRTSMFYAERMVVVGVDDADEAIAERADWEFVPLETAAEKADWELRDER